MAGNFKETILRLLSATNYSLDNLSEDNISSFENLQRLNRLFEWMSHSLSEANCITPEELNKFKELQESGRVKVGDDLEAALAARLYKDGEASVPFKESLNDAEEELSLLREQLSYKQALHQALCSSNAAVADDFRVLKEKQQEAEAEQKEVIKKIYSVTKTLKEKVSEVQANVNEICDDIIGLAQNDDEPSISSDEGIDSLTSENINPRRSLSGSVWSLATSSSWQTIRSKDSNVNYMRQLSFDKYRQMHKQFLKHLTKQLDSLSKVGRFQSNSHEHMDLNNIKERLEKHMFTLIEKEAELEGIRAERMKVREFQNTVKTKESLISRLKWEEQKVDSRIEEAGFNLTGDEQLAVACRQWAECKALRVVELKMKERIEYSKRLIEKMEKFLNPLTMKVNADKILLEVLQYEKERIEMSINVYKSFHQSMQNQIAQMRRRIETMQNNSEDFEEFCSLPLEERSDLLKQLASIVFSDNRGVVEAVEHLVESSRREHETMYEHFVEEKNQIMSSGKNLEETYNMTTSQCTSNERVPSGVIDRIQLILDQIHSGIEDLNNDVRDAIQAKRTEKKNKTYKEDFCHEKQ